MGCGASRQTAAVVSAGDGREGTPNREEESSLKAVHASIKSQDKKAAALGPPNVVKVEDFLVLDNLPECIMDLHDQMPVAIQQTPVRFLKHKSVLKWRYLKVYEDVEHETECLQLPYEETDDELWKKVMTVSWRWAEQKPAVYTQKFTPMSEVQFSELKALLLVAEGTGIEYLWVDWCCVPQYTEDSMVEVHRSKVFYARARAMRVLPTFRALPTSGPVRLILVKARRVLAKRAADTESLRCGIAAAILDAILAKNLVAGQEYFGRVWTLTERMARFGREEGLHNWLSLESWLGMVVDAMLKSTEDKTPSVIYKKILGQSAAGLLEMVLDPLATAVRIGGVQAEACEGLDTKVAELLTAAVAVWQSPSQLAEAPTKDWLRVYLGEEAQSGVYQAWWEADRVWAIYSYFCWTEELDQRSAAGLRIALENLVETAGGDRSVYVKGMFAKLGLDAAADVATPPVAAVPRAAAKEAEPPLGVQPPTAVVLATTDRSGGGIAAAPPSSSAGVPKEEVAAASIKKLLTAGARVTVSSLPLDIMRDAQNGHGGWGTPMEKMLGKGGVVEGVDELGNVRVQMDQAGTCVLWNPALLLPEGSASPVFSLGSTVIVKTLPVAEAQSAQRGHGGWFDAMEDMLGKTGIVASIDKDGDMCVEMDGVNIPAVWNPALLMPGSTPYRLRKGGHTDMVTFFSWSPDGKTLASGSEDKTIRLWDIATGQCAATLEGHTETAVDSVLWSPDGKTLASESGDNTIRLWDIANGGRCTATLKDADNLLWRPDGKMLAYCCPERGEDGENHRAIRLWDVATKQHAVVPQGVQAYYSEFMSWSADGSILAFLNGQDTKSIQLWEVAAGGHQCTATLKSHTRTAYVCSVAWSPDGKMLAIGDCGEDLEDNGGDEDQDDKRKRAPPLIRLWEVATRQCAATLEGHMMNVSCLAWSPDGKTLASGSDDKTIRLWDISKPGRCIETLEGHERGVNFVLWSPDGKMLIGGGDDGPGRTTTAQLWDVPSSRQCAATFKDLSGPPSWGTSGKTLVGANEDGTPLLWDVASRQQCLTVLQDYFRTWSSDGGSLAMGFTEDIVLWDLARGQITDVIPGQLNPRARLSFAAWSLDGKLLAYNCSQHGEGMMMIWNIASGQCITTAAEDETYSIGNIAWSPDGKSVACTDRMDNFMLWDAASGQHIPVDKEVDISWSSGGNTPSERTMKVDGGSPTRPQGCWRSPSPDGKAAVYSSDDGNDLFFLWIDDKDDQVPTKLQEAKYPLYWSPDGKMLASGGSDDKTIWLWDVASRCSRCVATLKGHTKTVRTVSWSPDGKTLASASSEDKTVRLWDIAKGGQCTATLEDLCGHLEIELGPDGNKALVINRLHNYRVHDDGGTSYSSSTELWDASTGKRVAVLEDCSGLYRSPDGKMLASCQNSYNDDKCVIVRAVLWNLASGRCVATLDNTVDVTSDESFEVFWSPDSKTLIITRDITRDTTSTAGAAGCIGLWDAASGQRTSTIEGVNSFKMSPDNAMIAVYGRDGKVGVWDVASRQCIATLDKVRAMQEFALQCVLRQQQPASSASSTSSRAGASA